MRFWNNQALLRCRGIMSVNLPKVEAINAASKWSDAQLQNELRV